VKKIAFQKLAFMRSKSIRNSHSLHKGSVNSLAKLSSAQGREKSELSIDPDIPR